MLTYALLCALVFVLTYLFTIVTTSIGYHRGLAHGAVKLSAPVRHFLERYGIWLTGVDAKGWVVMHRMHHAYSDTPDDPHTPSTSPKGVLGFARMFRAQLVGYNTVLDGLRAGDERYASMGRDLEMSWVSRTNRTWWPIVLHVVIGAAVGVAFGPLMGIALFAGMMSHVVQGAIINYFGHAHGGRNFESDDDSRNSHLAAWLVLGEGFQNNHHRWPSSARFSYLRREVDFGWLACLTLEKLGALEIQRKTLMPRASVVRAKERALEAARAAAAVATAKVAAAKAAAAEAIATTTSTSPTVAVVSSSR